MSAEKLVDAIVELIYQRKGEDVQVIELQKVTTLTDFFVICSAEADVQVKAIADNVEKSLRDEGIKVWHKEGYQALNWVLLDYVDVVVHIFKKETREYYNLEKLWGDAPVRIAEDPAIKKATAKAAEKKPAAKRPGRPRKKPAE